MMNLGAVPAGTTLYIPFASYGGVNGESITLTGLAVTDIEVYKDGSVTQRSSEAGYTLLDTDGIDFDGITGIHGFSIDLSDNTDSGFYAVGSWYWVVVSAVTIDAQTVNFVAAVFRIVSAEGVVGVPDVNTAYWANGAVTLATTTQLPEVDATSISDDEATADTLELDVGRLATIEADTQDLQSRVPAALVGGKMDVSVSAIVAAALADLFDTDSGTVYASAVAGSVVKEIADNAGGSALTEAGIADAVWDEALAGHLGAGSTGEALDAAGGGTSVMVVVAGTIDDVGPTDIDFDTDLAEVTDGHYDTLLLKMVDGDATGQCRWIQTYNGTSKNIVFTESFEDTPANGDAFVILAMRNPHAG